MSAIAVTDPNSPNEVTVIIKVMNKENITKARGISAFLNTMKESGIVGDPIMWILNYVTELNP